MQTSTNLNEKLVEFYKVFRSRNAVNYEYLTLTFINTPAACNNLHADNSTTYLSSIKGHYNASQIVVFT
jgi:hypothetical protein